jgi:hypothetical protein
VANCGGASKVGSITDGVDGRKENLKACCLVVAQLHVNRASRVLIPAMKTWERRLVVIEIRNLVTLY